MNRTALVAGNWKMNLMQSTGAALVEQLLKDFRHYTDVDVVVCPSFTMLSRMREVLRNSSLRLGAQDVFWAEKGAFTGCISASMLSEAGISHCIVGHSERRGRFGKLEIDAEDLGFFAETDRTINQKIRSLLWHSIVPIVCVGETLEERKAGRTEEVIRDQLAGAFENFDPAELFFMVVAYEPVWAIGTGETCASEEAERICAFIRSWFDETFDFPELGDNVRILYGGSVKASNAKELFSKPNIDGGLVGGASLDAQEFAAIIRAAESPT